MTNGRAVFRYRDLLLRETRSVAAELADFVEAIAARWQETSW
jgi:hypothetical protein